MKSGKIAKKYEKNVAPNYCRLPVALVEGKGCKVKDADGKVYLDLLSGLGANILGHAPTPVANAVAKQAKKLIHTSNLFYTAPQGELAETLVKLAFPSQALFVNSGAEAVESAIKLTRKYHHDKGSTSFEILAMNNSFHGRTYGALSATGQKKYHNGFAPLVPGFGHVPFGKISAVLSAVSDRTAGIIVEPVQGEGGINVAPEGYLQELREICDKYDVILIFDEVQCGMGRTGKWFAWQHDGVTPDIMTLSKGLGGGFPIGAMLAKPEIMSSFGPGTHASTFGGGPVACAAALAVIETVKEKKILQNVVKVSRAVFRELEKMKKEFPPLKEIRGRGLMIGMEFDLPAGVCADIAAGCLEEGLIINCIQDKVIRFLPPLNVTEKEMMDGIEILRSVLCKKIS